MNERLKLYQENSFEIPRQKLPGFIRWPIRVLAYPFMIIDLYSARFVQLFMKPKYKLEGACKKRGACCRFIHLGWPKKGKLSFFSKVYIFWQIEILGFYFKDFDFVEDEEVTKVMGCRYLRKDGSCSHYFLRPGLCRNWPKLHPLRRPVLLKGCGYKAVLRKKKF